MGFRVYRELRRDARRNSPLPLIIACVLVRFDHVARIIVEAFVSCRIVDDHENCAELFGI